MDSVERRKIIYMKAKTDKLADTVGQMYVVGCARHGWPRGVRWDKGTESVGTQVAKPYFLGY